MLALVVTDQAAIAEATAVDAAAASGPPVPHQARPASTHVIVLSHGFAPVPALPKFLKVRAPAYNWTDCQGCCCHYLQFLDVELAVCALNFVHPNSKRRHPAVR